MIKKIKKIIVILKSRLLYQPVCHITIKKQQISNINKVNLFKLKKFKLMFVGILGFLGMDLDLEEEEDFTPRRSINQQLVERLQRRILLLARNTIVEGQLTGYRDIETHLIPKYMTEDDYKLMILHELYNIQDVAVRHGAEYVAV